jgi:hypothetical protein
VRDFTVGDNTAFYLCGTGTTNIDHTGPQDMLKIKRSRSQRKK